MIQELYYRIGVEMTGKLNVPEHLLEHDMITMKSHDVNDANATAGSEIRHHH
jgi:hypothetical protein